MADKRRAHYCSWGLKSGGGMGSNGERYIDLYRGMYFFFFFWFLVLFLEVAEFDNERKMVTTVSTRMKVMPKQKCEHVTFP